VIQRPWAIVTLLTGLNLLNYLDRWLISAVSPNIKTELGLSDFQTGIVLNAFLVGYMLTSPVFGRLGDTMPRKWLIAMGVAVWCGATAASGLVGAFVTLVGVRFLVGVGEASYAALSPTIIDDITPPERKGRVLAIFFAAIPIGSALGFVLGGLLDKHYGWRTAFFVAGGPGALLVIACLFMVEPKRAGSETEEKVPLGKAIRDVLASRRYVWAVVGFALQTAVVGGFASWAPHYLVRKFHMDLAEANGVFGGVVVVTGLVGTLLGGFIADRLKDEDRMRAAMRVCAVSAIVSIPFCLACVLSPTPVLFFITIALAETAIWISFSPLNAVLLGSVPVTTRAMAMAISIFFGHVAGDLPAIPLIGLLSDAIGSLPTAMIALPILMVGCAVAWWMGIGAARPPATT
jgi:MFS transporter, Spinster family, sphingosine-1-phosphate transporter